MGCFSIQPTKRPAAPDVAQCFLDLYNDSCARVQDEGLFVLLKKCREMVHSCRQDSAKSQASGPVLSESDIAILLLYEDSWDDIGSNLRLAPETSFLLGAGIFWNFIDTENVEVPHTRVSRTTASPKGAPEV